MQHNYRANELWQIKLRVLSGGDGEPEKCFSSREREVVLGRASRSGGDVPQADNEFYKNQVISRKHCTLSWKGHGVTVHDNKSTHGTRIIRGESEITLDENGEMLHDGDVLVLGREVKKNDVTGDSVDHLPLTLLVSIKHAFNEEAPLPPASQVRFALNQEELIASDDEEEDATQGGRALTIYLPSVSPMQEEEEDREQESDHVVSQEAPSHASSPLEAVDSELSQPILSSPLPETLSIEDRYDSDEEKELAPSPAGSLFHHDSPEETGLVDTQEEPRDTQDEAEEDEDETSDPSSEIFDEDLSQKHSAGTQGDSDTSSVPSDSEVEMEKMEGVMDKAANVESAAKEMEEDKETEEKQDDSETAENRSGSTISLSDEDTPESTIPLPSFKNKVARFTLPIPKKQQNRNESLYHTLPRFRTSHLSSSRYTGFKLSNGTYGAARPESFSFRSVQSETSAQKTGISVTNTSCTVAVPGSSEGTKEETPSSPIIASLPDSHLKVENQSTQVETRGTSSQGVQVEAVQSDRAIQVDHEEVFGTHSSKRKFDEIEEAGSPNQDVAGQVVRQEGQAMAPLPKRRRTVGKVVTQGLAYAGVFAMGCAASIIGLALMPDDD